MSRTVLCIHPGSTGDVVLAMPALRAIRRRYRNQAMALLAASDIADLLKACGEVDAVFPLSGGSLAGLLADPPAMHPSLQEWLSRCDGIVGWIGAEGDRLRAGLARLGNATVHVGSPHQAALRAIHQADRYIEAIGDAAAPGVDDRPLALPECHRREGLECLAETGVTPSRTLLAVHPGSGSRYKCAQADILADIISHLESAGWRPIIVGGPADQAQVEALFRILGRKTPLVDQVSLATMAGLLSHVTVFVGHDSGLTHLAAAMHIPTVALFGPTDPLRWAPRGSTVRILTGQPCQCSDWAAVAACASRRCLMVSVEDVVQACQDALSHARPARQDAANVSPSSPLRLVLPDRV